MALAYKAYFAFISRPLSTSKGEPTSAVYGFVTQLFKIIEDTNPDFLAVAFDSKEKTFRHEKYDKYKSTRAEMPEDMIPQLDRIKQVIDAFKIPLYILPGYEADDLVGAAVKKAEKEGIFSYAVTPDKDYVQLITKNIHVIKPGKSNEDIIILDEQHVKNEFGFEPIQMIDYLALVGDSSDNIPGVAGIGPKTAVPLIREFGSIENLYKNIEKIDKKGVKNKLIDSKENAFLSKELATIITDIDFEIDFDKAKFTKPDFDTLVKLFAELEFKNFESKLTKIFSSGEKDEEIIIEENHDQFNKDNVKYHLVNDETELDKLVKRLENAKLFVFDTETDSLNIYKLNLAGISFCIKPGEAFFIPTKPKSEESDLFTKDFSNRLETDLVIEKLKNVFENEKIKKVCQNGKYDIAVLRNYGVSVNGFYFDTMLASYILDPDQKHGMDELAKKYLGYTPISIKELIGVKKDASKIFEADLQQLSDYASEDADITYRLYEVMKKELETENLMKLAEEVEFPLVEVLEEMERTGIKIDPRTLKLLSENLQDMLDEIIDSIYDYAGEEFNINSTKQLQVVLFEKLRLPKTKKTKTGFSTDASSLEGLKGEHEIIELLLDYRQYSKLKSTYADALPKMVEKTTGRIHTSYNQTVASTGRLSSLDPNLQNIPIRTELGKEIRKAFVPTNKDYVLLSADYSQIELRIMASICEDEALIKAFKDEEDIHRSTAAHVFMVDPSEVTPDMRRKAKEVNFGILYGIGPFGLKNRLGITQNHAKEIIDTYFNTFKNVKKFMDDAIENAKAKGYAETLLGRRRYLKNIGSSNRVVRQFEERVAINMPIQGTAADMIKIAMINIHNELKKQKFRSKMVLQVHDELVFDVYKNELDEIKAIVIELMENAMPLNVPVKVDTGIGSNWLEAH
ncbi:MAG: DNA polymerase I [Melioribacteraceae bacterium]|nr:DNA polymerase I [Melioribacteraceae bacterium]MCO6473660.1 DNA polymerase I [Melioribacteraceae bacterium]